jgi:hypothetical protein
VGRRPSWLRRRILQLYPSEFRARFGDEMEQVLHAAEHGRTSRPFRDAADLLVGAASQQWRYTMSTTSHAVSAPLATAVFVMALVATVGSLALTAAWVGFAP